MNEKTNKKVYAGFWVRVASAIIDILIIGALADISVLLITLIVHPAMSTSTYLKFIFIFFFGILFIYTLLYFAWFNSRGRQTPGKKLFGIIVFNSAMQPISFSKSLLRSFIYIIDYIVLGIGHLLVIFNKKKRAFHDFVAQTIVIRAKPKRKFSIVLTIAAVIAFYFLGEFFIGAYCIQAYRIPTGSLKPTLLQGDFIWVDKYSPINPPPKQSDWIVFKYPLDTKIVYIKRCIAGGGQTVEIKEGRVYIDGKPEGKLEKLEQKYDAEDGKDIGIYKVISSNNIKYVVQHYENTRFRETEYGPVVVPQDHYFVLGDNRDNSADSRVWGFVPEKNIVGRGGLIYFSWDKKQKKVRWSRIGEAIE